jgi:hypothetical protein
MSLVGLVLFKVSWNLRVVPILLANWYDKDFWLSDVYGSTASSGRSSGFSKGSGMAHSVLLMFNNVVAPCLATAAADSSCFLNFFIGPAPLLTSFSYPQCVVYSLTSCAQTEEVTVQTDFNPPFIYSYQCSSAILTRYVPMFLLMYSFTGVVLPVIHALARANLKDLLPGGGKSAARTRTRTGSSLSPDIDRSLAVDTEATSVYIIVKKVERYTMGIVSGMHWPVEDIMSDEQREALVQYKIKSITCNVMGSFAVLLTFGLSFPPLAFIIMLSIFSSTKMLRRVIREHVAHCPAEYFDFLRKCLERESYGLSTMLRRSSMALLLHSTLFLFFVMMDIDRSLPLAIAAVAIPLILSICYTFRVEIAALCRHTWSKEKVAWPQKSDDEAWDAATATSNPMFTGKSGGPDTGHTDNSLGSSVYVDDDDVVLGEERYSSMRMSNYRSSIV